jgi:hypothetical protein
MAHARILVGHTIFEEFSGPDHPVSSIQAPDEIRAGKGIPAQLECLWPD